jgi:cell division protein FtsI/penicillin-binding protein 2/cell division protein FtsW (lipid II flippase)
MAVTKSWELPAAVHSDVERGAKAPERFREFLFLLPASLLVAVGLFLVFTAKTQDMYGGQFLNLNTVQTAAQLDPVFQAANSPRAWDFLERNRPLPNVGALSRLHLLPLGKLKPMVIVRTPQEFTREFILWSGLYLLGFWAVHIIWRARRFRGDPAILPALQLLTGLGLVLMVSLRDPLRDTLEFKKFAWGVLLGCALLLLPLFKTFQHRTFSHWVYTPLLAAFALFVALLRLGSGPTGSDAKVNLGPFQPVELIKILLIFFMAGYFAQNWERLRDLHQKTFVPQRLRWLELPRFSHALPVMCGVACGLAVFFILKDMGPALVMGFVFLLLFAIARGRSGLALVGLFSLVAGVAIGYHYGAPHTVADRVSMWLSPWNNDVRGGEQLAQSLWAFATGGPWGSGPGWGDPSVIPAGHTDLVLSAIAEEWGLPGVAGIGLLFALLIQRAFRIALRAPDEYATFLSLGLASLIALEMLLISGGALGAIPLSGVVSPFLSSGNTAMLANFLIFAVLLGISNESATPAPAETLEPVFRVPVRVIGGVFAACALALIMRATYLEVLHDQDLLAKDALVYTQDGVKRPQHNPRLNLLAATIPRGDIFDRNGMLLATSSWDTLQKRRAQYQALGISIDTLSRFDNRFYPFGPATVHLLGDLRTGEKFHATNSSLIEHDSNQRLQGYSDYRELAPIVRFRHQHKNPQLQALLSRDRSVRSTIDIRLQLKANEILRSHLEPNNKKGALVVMNAHTGDILAMVNFPLPAGDGTAATPDQLLDRARYGEYPPGSTFKLVTAIAALRLNPQATENRYSCHPLGDGRVGVEIPGWRRPIRDDIGDHAHGSIDLAAAITVSCNAYFAQLGVFAVGSRALHDTAEMLGIPSGTVADVKRMLPFAAYGQGPVVSTPFKMARVAATIANNGEMPSGHWIFDSNSHAGGHPILASDSADFLAKAMRSVVTNGTARAAMAGLSVNVAGKTGTAQMDKGEPHAWFAGFAPYDAAPEQRLAFSVLVEHGGYGAKFAAPIARELVEAAQQLNLLTPQ